MKAKSALFVAAAAITFGLGSGLAIGHARGDSGVWATQSSQATPAPEALAHARSKFTFTVHAPMAVAATLFGPQGERGWGGAEWDPNFVYPQLAKDVEGAVFLVQHGSRKSTWVTTALDFSAGHVQYVTIVDGAMVTRIDIHLAPSGAGETAATIVYERTALKPDINEHVNALAKEDEDSGPHWESAINGYLNAQSRQKR